MPDVQYQTISNIITVITLLWVVWHEATIRDLVDFNNRQINYEGVVKDVSKDIAKSTSKPKAKSRKKK